MNFSQREVPPSDEEPTQPPSTIPVPRNVQHGQAPTNNITQPPAARQPATRSSAQLRRINPSETIYLLEDAEQRRVHDITSNALPTSQNQE